MQAVRGKGENNSHNLPCLVFTFSIYVQNGHVVDTYTTITNVPCWLYGVGYNTINTVHPLSYECTRNTTHTDVHEINPRNKKDTNKHVTAAER